MLYLILQPFTIVHAEIIPTILYGRNNIITVYGLLEIIDSREYELI